jgi:NTP pyrophosphatase (non-canonical NTP hydrolase)
MSLIKWTPTTDLRMLRRMGKLGEELGEAQAVASRVIIQGIDEVDPSTGKVNRQRLQDELADVQAQIGCTVIALGLDQDYMARRTADKIRQMGEWEAMFEPEVRPS